MLHSDESICLKEAKLALSGDYETGILDCIDYLSGILHRPRTLQGYRLSHRASEGPAGTAAGGQMNPAEQHA